MAVNDDLQVVSVQFVDDGVVFDYVLRTDVRKDGALQLSHTLFVGFHPDYRDELADLLSKAREVLQDALDDVPTSEVLDLADGSNDGEGMGFGDDS